MYTVKEDENPLNFFEKRGAGLNLHQQSLQLSVLRWPDGKTTATLMLLLLIR
jgi:hypothetical protein